MLIVPRSSLVLDLFSSVFLKRERDTDRDGKINFKEFFHGLFDLVRNYDDESHNASHDSMDGPARALFNQLDKDGDGYSLLLFSSLAIYRLFSL